MIFLFVFSVYSVVKALDFFVLSVYSVVKAFDFFVGSVTFVVGILRSEFNAESYKRNR